VRPARTARPQRAARTRTARSAVAKTPWRLRTSAYVRRLPDHALLDRIIRGRVWIPLLGLLLAGIVAMQVEVLKLNAGIGRSLERSSALQGQNELLRASVAQLSDDQRIERIAAQMGMVMPSPDQLRFVHTGPSSVQRALNSIHAPDGSTFISQLPTPGAPAAPQGTSINTNVGLTPSTTASSTSAAGGTTTGTTGTGTSTTTPATTTPATTTPATTSVGGTDQSGTSGGVGATPVGG